MSASAAQQGSTFDMIDRNHDGVITRSEFAQAAMMPTMTYAGAVTQPQPMVAGTTTYAAAAPIAYQQQAVTYAAPQAQMMYDVAQPVTFSSGAAPMLIQGQPQVTYAPATAQVVYEQSTPAVTYAAPAPAAVAYEQSAPAVTYAAPTPGPVAYEQTAPAPVTLSAAPAQMVYESTPAAMSMPAPVPTMISYPAAAPQAQTIYTTAVQPAPVQITYGAPAVNASAGVSLAEKQAEVQYASVDQQVAAGSASMLPAQSSVIGCSSMAQASPSTMLTYSAPVTAQPQAYYQVGSMQQMAGVQPLTYSAMAPTATMQPAGFEQSFQYATTPGAAPQMLLEQPQMAPATASAMEPAPVVQPEMMATTTQATTFGSKKAKKRLSSKKKEKACC